MRNKTRELCQVALAAALLCLISPWSVYIGGVPITLSFFVILLVSRVFKPSVAVMSTAVYVALGAVGVPVFAGFVGGFQALIGPTGGFIVCYPLVALANSTIGKTTVKRLAVGVASAILMYIVGFLWMSFTTDADFLAIFSLFAPIYLAFDLVKIFFASYLGDKIKNRLRI